jgi:hypothetical protein
VTDVRAGSLVRALLLAAMAASACERDAWIGEEHAASTGDAAPPGSSSGGTSAISRDGSTAGGATSTCHVTMCQNHVYACGDCIDDDGDGKVDMDDPDCLGPCHNSEESFFGSIPGQNHAACTQDCYFDQDSGSGNDDCEWSHRCDPLEAPPAFTPEGPACTYDPKTVLPRKADCAALTKAQSATCLAVCLPLTPNGCDCFGCCSVPGATTAVWLGSTDDLGNPTCDLAHVSDPARCRPCTQVPACTNPCESCELCVGKRELPPSCTKGESCPTPVCPGGARPCGPSCLGSCPEGQSCITGCCVAPPR